MARNQKGSIVLDKRTKVWYLRWRDGKTRKAYRIGPVNQCRSKIKAEAAVASIRGSLVTTTGGTTVGEVASRYMGEGMDVRFSTRDAYLDNLKNHIIPYWGNRSMSEVRPAVVQAWFNRMKLAPKTKQNIKGVLSILVEKAMFWEYIKIERNPLELVHIKDCTRRQEEPRILDVAEFQKLLGCVEGEPWRTMLLFDMCLGLRFSELVGMQWGDFDWLALRVQIQRGMVRQHEDITKTKHSHKPLPLAPQLAEAMKAWHVTCPYPAPGDWVWASPFKNGTQPYSYTMLREIITAAAKKAGLERVGWHTLRHSYRSWLDETGAPMTVQQNLMRHASITTTMNIYGDAIPESLRAAHGRVVGMAIQ